MSYTELYFPSCVPTDTGQATKGGFFMIQDIAPHTYHNEYKPVAPDENSIILAYENGKSFSAKRTVPMLSHFHAFASWKTK